jgi:uncharacterized protein (TIGR02246 family)
MPVRLLAHSSMIAAAVCIAAPAIANPAAEAARISAIEQEQAAAWNAHDAKRYAALFTADADVVNVLGWHWHGRAELERKLARGFAFVFANSQLSVHVVAVRFLKPDVAIAHVPWTMTGALSPTGGGATPPQQGLQTQVLVEQGGRWRIAAFQNANAVPEREFPVR